MIEVKNITKKYGKFTAVDNLNFKVEDHEIMGFLGPNGAGKSIYKIYGRLKKCKKK